MVAEAYGVLGDPEKRKHYDMGTVIDLTQDVDEVDPFTVFNSFFRHDSPFSSSFGRNSVFDNDLHSFGGGGFGSGLGNSFGGGFAGDRFANSFGSFGGFGNSGPRFGQQQFRSDLESVNSPFGNDFFSNSSFGSSPFDGFNERRQSSVGLGGVRTTKTTTINNGVRIEVTEVTKNGEILERVFIIFNFFFPLFLFCFPFFFLFIFFPHLHSVK